MDFFSVSKVAWFVVSPSNAVVILVGIGFALLLLGARRWGLRMLGLGLAGLVILGLSPVANYLVSPLEERFPAFHDDGRPVAGVIILGGAELPDIGLARDTLAFNEAGERVMAFADLARRYPQARLAFVGGSGALLSTAPPDAESKMIRNNLAALGIDEARVEFEPKSRNTAENAAFARELLDPRPGERWLLVTSAYHMPRAVGCFRAVGFPVAAYPVDFRTVGPGRLNDFFSRVALGLDLTDIAVREWIGLAAYSATGKIDTLFPAP